MMIVSVPLLLSHTMSYLFTSSRLGFRQWQHTDIVPMSTLNADAEVMKYFPSLQSLEETSGFIVRMQQEYAERGYCYYAVDTLHNHDFIGFIGLSWKTFQSPFTPCVDIGWRLARSAWGQGYATEGAKACLSHASVLGIHQVVAMAPAVNEPSVAVMRKAGMQYRERFIHPLLLNDERLRECVLYEWNA